jgi:hypothetical protein
MGHTTPTDSRSQRNRASRRGGQILTRALSSSYVTGLPSLRAPRCPGPGWSHHSASRAAMTETGGTAPFIPDTNPIESTFATVRLRERVTKGAGSRTAGLTMAFKLLEAAQAHWRRLDGAELIPLVRAGVRFVDGARVERLEERKKGAA